MTTTSLKLVEAISAQAQRKELRRKFIDDALAADREMTRSGRGYDFADVQAYFEATLAGKRAPRPRLKRWRK